MALTTALPIYKTTYDLLTVVTPMTANMPRAHKATLGKRLAEESMDLVVLIYRANSARDKALHLQQLLERMQVVELLLRLSRDLRLISTGQYARAIELTDAIGKQANGWRKHAAPPAA